MERPREQVLTAALEMVAEQGLAKVTMAALAARLGTSGGHLLYYFGTRDGLLIETLRWSEAAYAVQRAPVVEAASAAGAQAGVAAVVAFADVFLPVDDKDARWQLWLELWARAPRQPELAQAQRELDAEWHQDLVRLLRRAFPDLADPEGTSERLRAMWDGMAVGIVTGGGRTLRSAALDHTAVAVGEAAGAARLGTT